jgi:GMP reductase
VATKPIIADGGIREHGDIAKSIRFGATMVMIGSLLAGHEESPGQTVEVDGRLYKEYYGSASTSTRASTSTWKASASWSRSRASSPTRCARCSEDLQSPSAMPAARS